MWKAHRVPTRGTAIAVCEPRGVFVVAVEDVIHAYYLPGRSPPGWMGRLPRGGFTFSVDFPDPWAVKDAWYRETSNGTEALAFTDESHPTPSTLLATRRFGDRVFAVDLDTGRRQIAFTVPEHPRGLASSGSLAAVALRDSSNGWKIVIAVYRHTGGKWHACSRTPCGIQSYGRVFFSRYQSKLSVVVVNASRAVHAMPVSPAGKLGGVSAPRKLDVGPDERPSWRPECSNGRGGVFSVAEMIWTPGPPYGIIQEVDMDGSVLGYFDTGLAKPTLLAPFTGSCSGLVVYDQNAGRVKVLTSPNTIAQSRMSTARVAWMATVARAIQRRFRAPPKFEIRVPCVVQ